MPRLKPSQAIARVEKALSKRPASDRDIHQAWTSLWGLCVPVFEEVGAGPSSSADSLWLEILDANVIPTLFKLLALTTQHDPKLDWDVFTGSAAKALQTIGSCHAMGGRCLIRRPRPQLYTQTRRSMDLIEDKSPTIIADWWKHYGHLAVRCPEMYYLSQCCAAGVGLLCSSFTNSRRNIRSEAGRNSCKFVSSV